MSDVEYELIVRLERLTAENSGLKERLAEAERLLTWIAKESVHPSWQVIDAIDGFLRPAVSAPAVPIKADGMILKNGVEIIGDIHWHADVQQWRCLANVGGSLCVIEVKVTPDSATTEEEK